MGAVLSHTLPDGSEKPIAYSSRTLSSSEKNISQIEKESLSIIFAIKKFHQYIFGRHVTIVTDHKSLLRKLSEEKGIPQLAASRLQRWAIILSGNNYTLKYKTVTSNSNADCLSRFPKDCESDFSKLENLVFLTDLVESPVISLEVKNKSAKDPIISTVMHYIQFGWPTEKTLSPAFDPYKNRKVELTIDQGCLIRDNRVIIPKSLQPNVLESLHEAHLGIY